jgi:hypothetical protein
MGFLPSSALEEEEILRGEAATPRQSPSAAFPHSRRTGLATFSPTLSGLFHPDNTLEIQPSGSTPLVSSIPSPEPFLPCRFALAGVQTCEPARLRRLTPLERPRWTTVASHPPHNPPGFSRLL